MPLHSLQSVRTGIQHFKTRPLPLIEASCASTEMIGKKLRLNIYICISVSEDSRPSKLFLASQELKQRGREARGPGLFRELDQQLGV